MYCNRCGNKIQDNNKFCGKCGAKIDISRIKDTPNQLGRNYIKNSLYNLKDILKKQNKQMLIKIALGFVAFASICLFVFKPVEYEVVTADNISKITKLVNESRMETADKLLFHERIKHDNIVGKSVRELIKEQYNDNIMLDKVMPDNPYSFYQDNRSEIEKLHTVSADEKKYLKQRLDRSNLNAIRGKTIRRVIAEEKAYVEETIRMKRLFESIELKPQKLIRQPGFYSVAMELYVSIRNNTEHELTSLLVETTVKGVVNGEEIDLAKYIMRLNDKEGLYNPIASYGAFDACIGADIDITDTQNKRNYNRASSFIIEVNLLECRFSDGTIVDTSKMLYEYRPVTRKCYNNWTFR